MPTITELSPSPDNAQRVRVRVDGKTVATLPASMVTQLNLSVGRAWDPSLAASVGHAKAYRKCYTQAMNRVDRRVWASSKLHKKLLELGHDEKIVTQVLSKMTQIGALDDEAAGRSLIREIQLRKPAGARLLRVKLMQKGLDRALVDRLLSELVPDVESSVDGARELALKKLRTMSRLDPQVRQRRLYGLLARRGFGPDVISRVMENLPGLRDKGADFLD